MYFRANLKKTKKNPRSFQFKKKPRKKPKALRKNPRTQDCFEKPKILGENPSSGNAVCNDRKRTTLRIVYRERNRVASSECIQLLVSKLLRVCEKSTETCRHSGVWLKEVASRCYLNILDCVQGNAQHCFYTTSRICLLLCMYAYMYIIDIYIHACILNTYMYAHRYTQS